MNKKKSEKKSKLSDKSLLNNNGDNSSIGQFQPTKTDFLCSNKITLIKKVIKS